MKLTPTLCSGLRDVTIRKWNNVWKCRGRFYDYPPIIPQALKDKGIEVMEMNKVERPQQLWKPPVPDDPRFMEPVPLEERPDWKEVPAYTYHERIRLFEGVKQACLIAKAVHQEGLPPSVERLVGAVEVENKDLVLQRHIMQAQVWNTTEDKLPKRFDSRKPGWKFKREFGIPAHKSSIILLKNLLRLSQSQVTKFQSLANRRQLYQPMLDSYVMYRVFECDLRKVYYLQNEKSYRLEIYTDDGIDTPIILRKTLDFLVTSDTPLPPFGDESSIDASATQTIPGMWPAYPTVDFTTTHNYEFNNLTGLSSAHHAAHHGTPHTIVEVPRVSWWQPTHYQASQILSCLLCSAAMARTKYGDDVRILPEPISVQHIALRDTTFYLTFFQLNTLDLDSETGIKNLVWTSDNGRLCDKVPGQPWMPRPLKKTFYENFDSSVYDQFLAAYLNGVPELSA